MDDSAASAPPGQPVEREPLDAPDCGRIMQSAGEAAYRWRLDADTLRWSANATAMLGLRDAAAIATGRAFADLLDPANAHTPFDAIAKCKRRDEGQGVPYQVQYALRAGPRAPKLWLEDTGRWFAGDDGRPIEAQGLIRVINDRHEHEQRLAYLSRFDGLTGEFNRWHLTDRLKDILEETVRAKTSCGFLLIAIDNLARLNAAYGYDIADEIIAATARRIRGRMRTQDCLGRFSGNKFGVILRDCHPEDLQAAAERLLAGIRDDVTTTTAGPVAVTATTGGVTAPRHAASVDEIVARAQEALDDAKSKRRGSFLAYRPSLERDALRKDNARATSAIVTALNEGRVLLAYEPVVRAADRRPAFYECLMRIRRADSTFAPAGDIIPVAQSLGLVRLLDNRVLELAIAEMEAEPALRVSLNVSPATTNDPDWWAQLTATLRAHRKLAERVILEITEMEAIQDVDDTRGFVTRVKDLGARIAIDDFGAGYTSFRNLRKLGVDLVKIDGSFVQTMMRSADDQAFVHTLIDLAQRLKIEIVAEWVQDEATATQLARWGCDYLQGSLVGLAATERPALPQAAVPA